MLMSDYSEFLKQKAALAVSLGLECEPSEVHPMLKPNRWFSCVDERQC